MFKQLTVLNAINVKLFYLYDNLFKQKLDHDCLFINSYFLCFMFKIKSGSGLFSLISGTGRISVKVMDPLDH